jgi:hypothetical protein
LKEELSEKVFGAMELEAPSVKLSLEDVVKFFKHAYVATWIVRNKSLGRKG